MSINFEDIMRVEIKSEPADFIEEKFILDNTIFENDNPSIQNILIKEEPITFQENNLPLFSDQEDIDEKKRRFLVKKMLSKDYTPKTVIKAEDKCICLKQLNNNNNLSKQPKRLSQEKRKVDALIKKESDTVPDEKSKLAKRNCKRRAQQGISDLPYTKENCRKLFEGIFDGLVSPPLLSNNTWGFHRIETPVKTLVFTELGFFKDQDVPQVRKLITFDKDMNANVYVHNKLVLKTELNNKKRKLWHCLQHFLHKINFYQICLGGPPASKFEKINPTYAYRDGANNVWRHQNCKILMLDLKSPFVCFKCLNLQQTLEQHVDLINK